MLTTLMNANIMFRLVNATHLYLTSAIYPRLALAKCKEPVSLTNDTGQYTQQQQDIINIFTHNTCMSPITTTPLINSPDPTPIILDTKRIIYHSLKRSLALKNIWLTFIYLNGIKSNR